MVFRLTDSVEKDRKELVSVLDPTIKALNGQYMTPAVIAHAMANMFAGLEHSEFRLLDPGAGDGILTLAFLEMYSQRSNNQSSIEIIAYESDVILSKRLSLNLDKASKELQSAGFQIEYKIIQDDFISSAVSTLVPAFLGKQQEYSPYTHIIMNPPYRKLASKSSQRALLEKVGIETSNLYSAFVALSIMLLGDNGELVAITPRSFCNGSYFKSFRRFLLDKSSFCKIHVFDRRDDAFSEEKVLQENVIFHLKKAPPDPEVKISSSPGRVFDKVTTRFVPQSRIIHPDDPNLIIRIPANEFDDYVLERIASLGLHLDQVGFHVSTGPVVDFRVEQYILDNLEEDCVPLIYPSHFSEQSIVWPLDNGRKPNAIRLDDSLLNWLYPNDFYVLLKRFSSKEEKRRIYPALYSPISDFKLIGFENHLNVIRSEDGGLDSFMAQGLVCYFSSTIVDLFFRQFSGHTQVNATDLRSFPIPSIEILGDIAHFYSDGRVLSEDVDKYLERIFTSKYGITSPNPLSLLKNH